MSGMLLEGKLRTVGRIIWCPKKKGNIDLKTCLACDHLISFDDEHERWVICRIKKAARKDG